jgi:hypothetical protein
VKNTWFQAVRYRVGQMCQHLGPVSPLSAKEEEEVAERLPPTALRLFHTMSFADQRHALRVCQGLLARGCVEDDLLAAALLHDVGKAEGRVPLWTRPAIVIGKRCAPRLLSTLVAYPHDRKGWRRSLSNAWWHAEIGAYLAAEAGLSEQAVLYIRTHHQPDGPAAVLHMVDEVS